MFLSPVLFIRISLDYLALPCNLDSVLHLSLSLCLASLFIFNLFLCLSPSSTLLQLQLHLEGISQSSTLDYRFQTYSVFIFIHFTTDSNYHNNCQYCISFLLPSLFYSPLSMPPSSRSPSHAASLAFKCNLLDSLQFAQKPPNNCSIGFLYVTYAYKRQHATPTDRAAINCQANWAA